MTKRILTPLLLTLAAVGAAPAAASAAEFTVNQSAANASDQGPCDTTQPCLTIGAAVSRAQPTFNNTVRVAPDPNGTEDVYNERLVLDGRPIKLLGAGSARTTLHSPGARHAVNNASSVSDLTFDTPLDAPRGVLSRVSIGGAAPSYVGAARVFDSVIGTRRLAESDEFAAKVTGGRLVRTTVLGTTSGGVEARVNPVDLLNVTIRTGVGRGFGLRVAGDGSTEFAVRARHLTVMGFATRVQLLGLSRLTAADSTIAGPDDQDLRLTSTTNFADLTTTDFSPARLVLAGGSQASQVTTTDPLDVPPGLNSTGHLNPGSPLIDRGTAGGVLAGDPDDVLDIDRAPRAQGTATDVGADETGSAAPVAAEGELPQSPDGGGGAGDAADRTSARLTSLKVPSSFHVVCRRARKRIRAARCVAGLSITYRLSEAALVQFTFKRRRRGSHAVVVKRQASAGKVVWRFSGKVKGHVLPKGSYNLTISTIDLAGNRSKAILRRVKVL